MTIHPPKTPRKEMALLVLKELAKLGEAFTAEDFKNLFQEMERRDNVTPVSFGFGTIYGDVENMLLYLVNEMLVTDEGYGRYKHVIPSR